MKTVTRSTSLPIRLGLTAAALLLGQQALAVGTDAGTTVSNQASVAYSVSGNGQTPIESDPAGNSTPGAGNPTEFLVDRRVDFTLTADGVSDTVAPGDTGLTFEFTLTNTSNSTMDFEVSFVQLASTDPAVNTLVDFRVARRHRAASGRAGAGRNKTGRSGEDLDVRVPCGTVIRDIDTGELAFSEGHILDARPVADDQVACQLQRPIASGIRGRQM